MKFLLHIFLLILLSSLAGAAWVAHRPEVLAPAEPPAGKVIDLADQLRQAAIKRSARLEWSDDDLSASLNARLGGEIDKSVSEWTQFKGLAVELRNSTAHVVTQWSVLGEPRTVSVDLDVTREGETFRVRVLGGAYGRLKVMRGLLRPMSPTFDRIASVFGPELDHLFKMNQIEVQEGKLVLDPRF